MYNVWPIVVCVDIDITFNKWYTLHLTPTKSARCYPHHPLTNSDLNQKNMGWSIWEPKRTLPFLGSTGYIVIGMHIDTEHVNVVGYGFFIFLLGYTRVLQLVWINVLKFDLKHLSNRKICIKAFLSQFKIK